MDNNLLFFLPSLTALGYHIYSKFAKVYNFPMVIDDRKKNVKEANRIGLLYKFKFIFYTLLTMLSVSFLVLNYFGPFQFMDKLKIIYRE